MGINKVIFLLLFFTALICITNCQVCVKNKVFTEQYIEYRPYVYISKIPCDGGTADPDCWKTKYESTREPVIQTKRIVKTINYCCAGYEKANTTRDDDSIECQPSCTPKCVNGKCERPGKCKCNKGYVKSPKNNLTCHPICTEPCYNKTCVAPNTCGCEPGYRISKSNACEPYCLSGCDHGTCIAPDVCSCDDGWILNKFKRCEPICDPKCKNGRCVAPNRCTNEPGYLSEGNFSEPNCKNCNGSCIAPYNCECDPPFIAKNVTADLKDCNCFTNCTDLNTVCEGTICVESSTLLVYGIERNSSDTVTTEKGVTYSKITESTTYVSDVTENSSDKSHTDTPISERYDPSITNITIDPIVLVLPLTYPVEETTRDESDITPLKNETQIINDESTLLPSENSVNFDGVKSTTGTPLKNLTETINDYSALPPSENSVDFEGDKSTKATPLKNETETINDYSVLPPSENSVDFNEDKSTIATPLKNETETINDYSALMPSESSVDFDGDKSTKATPLKNKTENPRYGGARLTTNESNIINIIPASPLSESDEHGYDKLSRGVNPDDKYNPDTLWKIIMLLLCSLGMGIIIAWIMALVYKNYRRNSYVLPEP